MWWCRVMITEHRVYSHLYQALPYYNKQTLSCLNWLESSRAITNHQLNRYNHTITSSENMYIFKNLKHKPNKELTKLPAPPSKNLAFVGPIVPRKYTYISKRSSPLWNHYKYGGSWLASLSIIMHHFKFYDSLEFSANLQMLKPINVSQKSSFNVNYGQFFLCKN